MGGGGPRVGTGHCRRRGEGSDGWISPGSGHIASIASLACQPRLHSSPPSFSWLSPFCRVWVGQVWAGLRSWPDPASIDQPNTANKHTIGIIFLHFSLHWLLKKTFTYNGVENWFRAASCHLWELTWGDRPHIKRFWWGWHRDSPSLGRVWIKERVLITNALVNWERKEKMDWVRQSNHTIHNQYCTAGAEGAVGEFVPYWSAKLEKKMMKEPNCSDPREVEIRLEWTRAGGENEKSNLTQFPKKSVTRYHYLQKGSSILLFVIKSMINKRTLRTKGLFWLCDTVWGWLCTALRTPEWQPRSHHLLGIDKEVNTISLSFW